MITLILESFSKILRHNNVPQNSAKYRLEKLGANTHVSYRNVNWNLKLSKENVHGVHDSAYVRIYVIVCVSFSSRLICHQHNKQNREKIPTNIFYNKIILY